MQNLIGPQVEGVIGALIPAKCGLDNDGYLPRAWIRFECFDDLLTANVRQAEVYQNKVRTSVGEPSSAASPVSACRA